LRDHRAALVENWRRAIAHTAFVSFSAQEVSQRLVELTDQAIDALLAEPFDPAKARGIGAALARLHYVSAEALGRTQEVLARELVAGPTAAQVTALQPRLAALLGEVAAGFFDQARLTILDEQEKIRGALFAERQQAMEALRASEARFRAIFYGSAVGVALSNMTGQMVEANPAMQSILG